MIDYKRPCSALWFASSPKRPSSPNGYHWDEDAQAATSFVAFCKRCAQNCNDVKSQFCCWWDVEGQKEPGQPLWAYVGNIRLRPKWLEEKVLRDGINEFLQRGVRVFATVRSSVTYTDWHGNLQRSYAVDHEKVLAELFDYYEALGISGAYYDSNGVTGRRMWRKNLFRANNGQQLIPRVVDGMLIRRALSSVGLNTYLSPWGQGGFDVFCEFPDTSYDQLGFGYWCEFDLGDVRFKNPRLPGEIDHVATLEEQQAYKSTVPSAYRVVLGVDKHYTDPNREKEITEAMQSGCILATDASASLSDRGRPSWRVRELYQKVHGA